VHYQTALYYHNSPIELHALFVCLKHEATPCKPMHGSRILRVRLTASWLAASAESVLKLYFVLYCIHSLIIQLTKRNHKM